MTQEVKVSRRKLWILSITLLGVWAALLLVAPAPSSAAGITIQGRLTGDDGQPTAGAVGLTLSIYDTDTATNPLWREEIAGVQVTNGIFAQTLGTGRNTGGSAQSFAAVFTGQPRFVGVQVNGGTELRPRILLTDAGHALTASSLLDSGSALTAANFLRRDGSGETTTTRTIRANGLIIGVTDEVARLDNNGFLDVKKIKIGGQEIVNTSGNLVGAARNVGGSLPKPGFNSRFELVNAERIFDFVSYADPLSPTPVTIIGPPEENFVVDQQFFAPDLGVNNRAIGSDVFDDFPGGQVGSYWTALTTQSLKVVRVGAASDQQQHLRVWSFGTNPSFPAPLFKSSNWTEINPGQTSSVTFPNVFKDHDKMVVSVIFFKDATNEIHNTFIGTDGGGGFNRGALWQNLKTSGIDVVRRGNDSDVDKFRVRVWEYDNVSSNFPKPDFDSGYIPNPDSFDTFMVFHNLNVSPERMLVDLTFRSDQVANKGINIDRYGGDSVGGGFLGANWQNLTTNSIEISSGGRAFSDLDFYRVRIWVVGQ
ncbi:MAG: hypothetical protein HY718_15670 [Planctomycetes bacterium]|nr:hypothetical protein [Planctomycetota bacterium]